MPDSQNNSEPNPLEPATGSIAPPQIPGIVLEHKALRHNRRAALYRGWDRVRLRDVLVKVQREEGDPAALTHFRREATVLVRLRHPGIASVYQFLDGVSPAVVIETVSGRTLDTQVRTHGALSLKRAAKIIEDVAAALDCVHAHGIVHHGMTPATIVLPFSMFPIASRSVKLTDFSVARVAETAVSTEAGLDAVALAGSEAYLGEINPGFSSLSHFRIADDLYALAALAYFALTGYSPGQDSEPFPLRLHRPELPLALETVVLRGLAKAPSAYYASAGQFAADLRAAIETALSDPKKSTAQGAITSASSRTGILAGGMVGTAMLLGAGLLWKAEHRTLVPSPSHSLLGHTIQPEPVSQSGPIASSALPPKAASIPPTTKRSPAVPIPLRQHTMPRLALPSVAAMPSHILSSALSIRRPQPNLKSVAMSQPSEPKAANARQPQNWEGFLLLTANQNIAPLGQSPVMADIPAQALRIDGKSVPVPPSGGWIALPAGKHRISYYPAKQGKFGPRLAVPITVASGAHIRRQIPLPFAIGRPTEPRTAVLASALRSVGWYTVSGWAALPSPAQDQNSKPTLVRANAQQVMVDGQPNLNLALGQWAELPAGKHTIVFQPATGLGVGAKTWEIALDSQAHLNQQVPLPAVPVGWYTVSGWAAIPLPSQDQNSKPMLVRANVQRVMVDGHPNLKLTLGQWAELPAGPHTITFQPTAGSWVGAKTWDITLDPQAHLNQQVPLPPLPVGWYTVSGWIPVPTDDFAQSDQKSALVRTSAQQVMVDGQPNLTLALGRWAELSAGPHTITFLPTPGVNAAPKTWTITLRPLARLSQQIPLSSDVPAL